jgi:RNA polymerase sigma-70 factor (ECF subfamily)
MPFSVVEKIDAPEATIVSFRHSATEEKLVAAAKNGNEQAFEILVKRYEKRIQAVAQRYTRVHEDAKDVVQQTFQNAFVHLQRFESKSSFSTWLTRIAINQALMLLRRRHALREVPVDEATDREGNSSHAEMSDSSSDPEASYASHERVQILTAAIGSLRPGLRRAVELRELGELSMSETARRLGLSVGAVKAQVFHARRKLRQALTSYARSSRMRGNEISAHGLTSISRDRPSCAARS